jgi:hypothetical protein
MVWKTRYATVQARHRRGVSRLVLQPPCRRLGPGVEREVVGELHELQRPTFTIAMMEVKYQPSYMSLPFERERVVHILAVVSGWCLSIRTQCCGLISSFVCTALASHQPTIFGFGLAVVDTGGILEPLAIGHHNNTALGID